VRIFSYRNKRAAKHLLLFLGIAALVFLMFFVIRFIYLQRFLVYSNGTIQLNYNQQLEKQPEAAPPVWDDTEIEIILAEPEVQINEAYEEPMKTLTGFYITTKMLSNIDAVHAALAEQETAPKTIMLDLKSIYGNFYYSSGTSGATMATAADIGQVDLLIEELAERPGTYLIARIASLSDYNFALANQSCGLPMRSGALWMDSDGCFWLDPMSETVQAYLASIAQELAQMGFDEVVFDDFRIPDSTSIVYNNELSREEAAAEAAASLRENLAAEPIRISFNSENPNVAASSDRVYLVTEDGSSVSSLVESVQETLEDPSAQIVFLTASRDTRFEGYGILRPLIEERTE